jgi:hypothetical protein
VICRVVVFAIATFRLRLETTTERARGTRKHCLCVCGEGEGGAVPLRPPRLLRRTQSEGHACRNISPLRLFPALVPLAPSPTNARRATSPSPSIGPHPHTNPARFHRIACVFPGFAVVSWIAAPCRLSRPAPGTSVSRFPFLDSTRIVICFALGSWRLELIPCGGLQLHCTGGLTALVWGLGEEDCRCS